MAKRHSGALVSWVLSRGGNPAEAWDLAQATFEKALRTRPALRDHSDLRGWLLVVLRNQYVDSCRAGERRFRVIRDLELEAAPEVEAPPLWRQVDIDMVHRHLGALSAPLREAFELRLFGWSPGWISAHLGVPLATINTRLFRARQRLGEILRAELDVEGE